MKLYGTITSERATKGQGGNKNLEIDIFVFDRYNPRYHLSITPDELKLLERGYSESIIIRNHKDIREQEEKAKKEKGEKCVSCNMIPDIFGRCKCCNKDAF